MQTCSNCGRQNQDQSLVCNDCGKLFWAKFWTQWTPEQRERLERSETFLKVLKDNDIFAAQEVAIGSLCAERGESPQGNLATIYPALCSVSDDLKQLHFPFLQLAPESAVCGKGPICEGMVAQSDLASQIERGGNELTFRLRTRLGVGIEVVADEEPRLTKDVRSDRNLVSQTVTARLSRRQLQRIAFLAKWSKVDWSKQNCELAEEMSLSRERIRQIRQQVGAPKPTHRHHRMRKSSTALQWAKANLEQLKGLSVVELVRKYGLSFGQGSALYQFLKPFLRDGRRKHRWDLMNFSLPNRDLERIWRLPYNMVGPYRFRKQIQRPTWYFGRGRGYMRFSGRGQFQAYRRTLKAEERKAALYFAQV